MVETEIQPYVGPQPFGQKDQSLFFGRDREARDILSLVIANNTVLIYAQSGAGKTSLINARLIPLLKKEGFEVFPLTRVRGITIKNIKTEEIPNIFVFNTLMNWVSGTYDVNRLVKMTLADFLKQKKHRTDEDEMPLPRAIIFDQFEELFTLYQDRWKDRDEFFRQLRDVLEADPLLRIVFVIREDYIAQLDAYISPLPDKLRTRFHLERLRKEAALLAVTGPLNDTDRSFANDAAEKLVNDLLEIRVEITPGETIKVIGEFVETVQLQVVCQSLWQSLPENVKQITKKQLETYGNVEKALSRFYNEAIRTAAKKARIDEERLRNWCEEILITSMETRGMVYRAPESTGGIPNTAIDVLENKHLIRAEQRSGARWYELTHDLFIEPILSSNKFFSLSKTEGLQEKEIASQKATKIITKAEQEWGMKNFDEALKFYHEALGIYRDINDSWGVVNTLFNIGHVDFEMEDYKGSIEKLQKAIEIDPNYAKAYYSWGVVLRKINRHEEAIEKYQKAIEIDPDHADDYNGWGNVLLDLNRHEEAIEKYQKAIEIDPNYASAYYNWGNVLLDLNRHEEAIEKYQKTIEIDPDYANAYYNWGNVLLDLNRHEEAIEKYQKAYNIYIEKGQVNGAMNAEMMLDKIQS